ncbi:hypothetical protein [Saccharothrix variisporea]|uniref:PknH-like protein n=1 Tax=Saccharothrix variisporea TaxID=543527 RepID=A0A495X4Q8_9PSEU|nr:hypothetical protein [Saccharothrix variisporea]RKT68225.1 hypothetical protein DFJ66_1406 [Saccharothrix variisporea]
MKAALVLALLLSAGCTAAPPPPTSTPPATTTTTAVTTTTAAGITAETAPARLKTVVLPGEAAVAAGAGAGFKDDWTNKRSVPRPCDPTQKRVDYGYYIHFVRQWEGERFTVFGLAAWFEHTTAADVVARVKAAAESCTEYQVGDDHRQVITPVTFPDTTGLSASYAFCEDDGVPLCFALLAHDHVLSMVVVTGALDRLVLLDKMRALVVATAPVVVENGH